MEYSRSGRSRLRRHRARARLPLSPAAFAALIFAALSLLIGIFILETWSSQMSEVDARELLSLFRWLIGIHAGFLALLVLDVLDQLTERPRYRPQRLAGDLGAIVVFLFLLTAFRNGAGKIPACTRPGEPVFEFQYDPAQGLWTLHLERD
ncbi:MAG: hypothetical protein H8E31_04170 [Planctomycetes bacterium]|nr:hypothetical protein [Planctomycetota bacterium]